MYCIYSSWPLTARKSQPSPQTTVMWGETRRAPLTGRATQGPGQAPNSNSIFRHGRHWASHHQTRFYGACGRLARRQPLNRPSGAAQAALMLMWLLAPIWTQSRTLRNVANDQKGIQTTANALFFQDSRASLLMF
jgi:hypothetical protein